MRLHRDSRCDSESGGICVTAVNEGVDEEGAQAAATS
jgi:hypothetical protein